MSTMDLKLEEYKQYHHNGELCQHCSYKGYERHGAYKLYHNNGKLWLHCFYKDGKQHGEFKSYWDNGDICRHCFYKDDTEEALSEYIEDPDNITDDEFMNLAFIFGDYFFASNTFIGAAS